MSIRCSLCGQYFTFSGKTCMEVRKKRFDGAGKYVVGFENVPARWDEDRVVCVYCLCNLGILPTDA